MRLVKCKKHSLESFVDGRTIYEDYKVSCYNCNASCNLGNTYADLDGEPFRAYYCEHCKNNVESAILDEQQELLTKGQE